jgi:hypothetical protein
MKLCFDSIEEVKDFVGSLKGTRGKKGDADDGGDAKAPPPIMPPVGGASTGFTSPASGFIAQGGFPPAGDPAVQALVTRINTKIDGALASGQPQDAALQWFRGQCGPEAAAATMDQIKTVFLPRLTLPALENIAKLMGA